MAHHSSRQPDASSEPAAGQVELAYSRGGRLEGAGHAGRVYVSVSASVHPAGGPGASVCDYDPDSTYDTDLRSIQTQTLGQDCTE